MLSKLRYFFQESWLLMSASFLFGLLLAVTNAAWQGDIQKNQQDKFNNLAAGLLPGVKTFERAIGDMSLSLETGKEVMINVEKALGADDKCVGWAFVCQGPGFADVIKLVVSVDAGFERLTGYGVLGSNETPGFGDKIKTDYFKNQFIGAPAGTLRLSKTGDAQVIDDEIIAITGATVSSEAVVRIFNTYISQVKIRLETQGLLINGE